MKTLFLATAISMGVSACDSSSNVSAKNPTEMVTSNPIFGKWQTTEKTPVTTPFGTVWTLNSAEFGKDGRTLTGEFTKEDGNPMTEHLTYDFMKNYQNSGRDAVIMHNNYLKDLVVVFTVEKCTDTELQLRALLNKDSGNLDFGSGILTFRKIH